MDARLQFEWSNDRARDLVSAVHKAGFFGPGNEDLIDRDDADYEISLTIKLSHKRKSRKKSTSTNG